VCSSDLLGSTPFQCGANSSCPEGFTATTDGLARCICVEGTNVADGTPLLDGAQPTCNDDPNDRSTPNDTIANATDTKVGVNTSQWLQPGLAICPATDVDYFKLTAYNGDDIEAQARYNKDLYSVSLQIVEADGSVVADSQDSSEGCLVTAQMTSNGVYYIKATTAVPNKQVCDYQIAITIH
jgi:hypothetical protein